MFQKQKAKVKNINFDRFYHKELKKNGYPDLNIYNIYMYKDITKPFIEEAKKGDL